jgi:hypothetical protein
MKFFIPFFLLLFCSCNEAQQSNIDSSSDSSSIDSAMDDFPATDSLIDEDEPAYAHLLEIISEYSFQPGLMSTYDEAMEWLSSEGIEPSTAYSEEESLYNVDFEIRSTNEDASCAFHFEYSADGDYSTYRHIIINVQEDLKSAFIEELKEWYIIELELESIEAKCYQKKWGATGYVWEQKTQYGIIQTSIQRSPADDSYPWIELRRNGYKDVSDDELIDCD